MVQSLWRTVRRFLKKLKIELPYDLQSHSWAYIREKHDLKGYTHSMFIAALFTIAKIWKQPKCPSTEEWIKKMQYTHTHTHTTHHTHTHTHTMEYFSAIKRRK